jgi:GH24 family phage-related lysozyme (muramidase)
MRTSERGLALIEESEARRHKAYLDGGGVPTIGVGHTRGARMGHVATDGPMSRSTHGSAMTYSKPRRRSCGT